jgi:hypothetical protein
MFYFNSIQLKAELFKKNLSAVMQTSDSEALKTPAMEKYRSLFYPREVISPDDEDDDKLAADPEQAVPQDENEFVAAEEVENKEGKPKSYERQAADVGKNEDLAFA